MSPITSIEVFLAHVRSCPTLQDDQVLERRIATWLAYYRTLQFVRQRYSQLNTAYVQAITRYLHTRETHPETPDEATRAEAEVLREHLQKKYGSFYIFAIGLLDSMADVWQCYFGLGWPRSEITHAHLTRDFPVLCRDKGLVLTPTALPRLMRELHADLVASPSRLTALVDEHPEAHLIAVSTAINVYIAAMMQFFARNEEHSVLYRAFAAHS